MSTGGRRVRILAGCGHTVAARWQLVGVAIDPDRRSLIVTLVHYHPLLSIRPNQHMQQTKMDVPTTPKLDLAQIISHPLVQNRLEQAKSPSRVVAAPAPAAPGRAPVHQTPASQRQGNWRPAAELSVPTMIRHHMFASPGNQIRSKHQVVSPQAQDGRASPADDNNNANYRVRRSTSLSYTSTLRKRRNQTLTDGFYNSDLPSPRPNIVLPNFSISPYSDTPRRLSYDIQ